MLNFLKKYGYYIMLAVCLICIGTMIVLAVTYNNELDELRKPKTSPLPSISTKPSTTPKITASPNPTKPVDVDPVFFHSLSLTQLSA